MRGMQWVIVKVLRFRFLLSQEANTGLMRSCWNELFILGLAQCAHIMNLSTILTAIISHLQSSFQDGTEHKTYRHYSVHTHAREVINYCLITNDMHWSIRSGITMQLI